MGEGIGLFANLIVSADLFARQGCHREDSEQLQRYLAAVVAGDAKLEVRVKFNPFPAVACEVRDNDGELLAVLFEEVGRPAQRN